VSASGLMAMTRTLTLTKAFLVLSAGWSAKIGEC
jgi:hypothetical protein